MSDTAVLAIDMLNAYRHEDAELLIPNVADIIDPLAGLISVARERDDVDLIYVNDNYGDFTADHDDIVRSALQGARPDLVKPIVPDGVLAAPTEARISRIAEVMSAGVVALMNLPRAFMVACQISSTVLGASF